MKLRATTMLVLLLVAAPPAAAQLWQMPENPSGNQLHDGGGYLPQLAGRTVVRSKVRTTVGATLALLGGTALFSALYACEVGGPDADRYDPRLNAAYDHNAGECVLDGRPDPRAPQVWAEQETDARMLWGGVGASVLGLLLMTVWSDVEVDNTVSVSGRLDGGVEVSKRINIW